MNHQTESMPKIGFGVFRLTDSKECEEAVVQAIQTGYRLIDTAAAYENEEAVGRAIRRCGVPREQLFLTTKLWISDTNYEGAKRGLERSLKRLQTDYVDLYLIHQPYHDYYGAWRALEELQAQGKARTIGVDNFTQDRMADFLFFQQTKTAANMLECNVFFQREDERAYLASQGIQMQAWSPLAAGSQTVFENEVLCSIAQAHDRTVAQIVLRWLIQRGIVPIVKSQNPRRMQENLDVFDFSLTEQDMQRIAALDTGHTCFTPRKTAKSVQDFLTYAKNVHV